MTDVLSDNNARCVPQVCEFGLNSPLVLSHPVAAKTGTTNDWTDNWTVGYTPQIDTGVWTGNADHTAMVNVIGITGAAPIWQQYMEGAFSILKLPSVPFVMPPNVIRTAECSTPGNTVPSAGPEDLYVLHDPIPMCRIPDRGPMPVSCANYPKPTPFTYACVYLAGYPGGSAYPYGTTYPYNTTNGRTQQP
jgi:membrane peptidoglycan carboxypeptidase